MNQKLLSVFFSALLSSTFAHEYLRAHELTPKGHNARNHVGPSKFRNLSHDTCSWQCPVPQVWAPYPGEGNHEPLRLATSLETDSFLIINITTYVAIVFDLEVTVLINGKTGATILLELEGDTGYYFTSGSSDKLYDQSKSLLIDYLKNLGSLSNMKKWKFGETFQLKSAPKKVTTLVLEIVRSLSPLISLSGEKNPQGLISTLVALSRQLKEAKEIVKPLLKSIRSAAIVIGGGLVRFVSTITGLRILDKKLVGGLESLIKDDSDFELSLLLAGPSGLQVIGYLLKNAENLDLAKILGDMVKTPEGFLGLVVELDGGLYPGYSGLTAVIYNMQLYVANKISLEALIDILIQTTAQNVVKIPKEKWSEIITFFVDLIKVQTDKYKNENSWTSLSQFFQNIKENKLIIRGINVSNIINGFIAASGKTELVGVINVLIELKSVTSLTTSLATLFLRLVWFILGGEGVIFVLQLLPKISISIDFSSTTSIIKQILGSVQITKLMQYIITLDVVGLLTHLPVIGPIFDGVQEALKASGEVTKITLTSALKETGSVVSSLKSCIWFGLGLESEKQPSGGKIAGLSSAGGGATVSWNSKWTSSVSVTQSSSSSGSSGSSVSGGGSSSSGSSGSGVGGGSSSGGWGSGLGGILGGGSSSSGGSSAGSGWGGILGGGSSSGSGGGGISGGGLSSGSGGVGAGGSSSGAGSSSGSGGGSAGSGWHWSLGVGK